jgi:dTDP-4-amino-4,6-dideoxygalactose transaminase
MWSYKEHGKRYETKYDLIQHKGFSWTRDSFGTNFRMTEMQAAIGRIQLKRMIFWHNKRLSNANKIWNIAKEFKGLSVPNIPDYIEHAAYKCYLFVRPFQLKKDWNRDRIIDEINSLGVPCSSGSCPEVYLERAFDATDFRPIRRLKNSKELGETSLMFLVHPTLKDDEIQKTCDTIRSVMKLAS